MNYASGTLIYISPDREHHICSLISPEWHLQWDIVYNKYLLTFSGNEEDYNKVDLHHLQFRICEFTSSL